jgi:hypothetical protein
MTLLLAFFRGFKALKQLTKITFKLKRFEESLTYYKRLLPYTKSAVTRKYVIALTMILCPTRAELQLLLTATPKSLSTPYWTTCLLRLISIRP